MDMAYNKAVGESPHCVAQDITIDGLYNVLHELRTIAFDSLPFLCISNTFVGDGFTTELVLANLWFYIAKASAGREYNEQHSTLVNESDAMSLSSRALLDSCLYCIINIPPKLHDVRIGCSP